MSITTKDVLAVLVVGAVMVFAGISMVTGKPLDAGTFGMAGLIVGHYFTNRMNQPVPPVEEGPLAEPYTGASDDE